MRKTLLILLFAMSLLPGSVNAQNRERGYSDVGYWGNVELLGGALFPGGEVGVSTTHGCHLGNGVSMGLGAGFYCDLKAVHHLISVPFFMEAKYSLLDSSKSPYISLRTGFSVTNRLDTGAMNMYPTDVQLYLPSVEDDLLEVNTGAIVFVHTLSVGVALNF